jgi:arginyl-tRNA--protein-N-Asp/Glu arginylyltransferase
MPFLDRMHLHSEFLTFVANTFVAKMKNKRVKRWVSARGGNQRSYVCNICGYLIDTESANYKPTKHAEKAIEEHKDAHLEEYTKNKASKLYKMYNDYCRQRFLKDLQEAHGERH